MAATHSALFSPMTRFQLRRANTIRQSSGRPYLTDLHGNNVFRRAVAGSRAPIDDTTSIISLFEHTQIERHISNLSSSPSSSTHQHHLASLLRAAEPSDTDGQP
ncbi:hypothetical protein ACLOJK_007456 [Asimina triloba]